MKKKGSDFVMNKHNKIEKILNSWGIPNYTINSDGSVDVRGSVDISNKGLKGKISDYVTFGVVSGHFDCYNNQLTSLEGAPKEVGGGFYCYQNQLTSLDGAPKEVGGYFDCSYNTKHFTADEVKDVSRVGGSIYISSYKKVENVDTRHLIAHKMSLLLDSDVSKKFVWCSEWKYYEISKQVYTWYRIFNCFERRMLNILDEFRK